MTNLPPLPPLPPRPQKLGSTPSAPVAQSRPVAPLPAPVKGALVTPSQTTDQPSQVGYAAMTSVPTPSAVAPQSSNGASSSASPNTNVTTQGEQTIWDGAKKLFAIYVGATVGLSILLWPYMVLFRGEEPALATIVCIILIIIVAITAVFVCLKQKPVTVNWNDGTVKIGKLDPRPISDLKYCTFKVANNGVAIKLGFDKAITSRHLGGIIKAKEEELEILENILRYSGLPEGSQGDGFKTKNPWFKQDAINGARSLAGKDVIV